MPLYLSPYKGSGAKSDPFRPKYNDPGWSAIDLRSDGTLVGGFCLLWLPIANAAIDMIELGDDISTVVSLARKTRLTTALGLDVTTQTTLGDILDFLLFNRHTGKWNPVQARQNNKEQEIYLDRRLWIKKFDPTARAAVPIDPSDNFNRANENPLAGNWTKLTGAGHDFQLITNEMGGTGTTNDSAYYWNPDTPPNDQWSEIQAGTALGTTSDWGPCCRCSTTAFSLYTASAFSTDEQLGKFITATYTTILSITTTNIVSGDILRVEVQGSTLRYLKNGVEQTGSPATDTSLTSGRWGVYMTNTNPRLDNWQGGDFATKSKPRLHPPWRFIRRR